jgi:hypothetical protein
VTKSETAAEPAEGTRVAKLSKPILVMGKLTSELTFREPTAEDIERFGFPLIIDEDDTDPAIVDMTKARAPDVRFDEKKMTAHMAVLSNAPIADIRRMSPRDWLSCAYVISVFFLQ